MGVRWWPAAPGLGQTRPAADLDAAVAAVQAISGYALAHQDALLELDVNPLLLRPAGLGAVAADALVRLGADL